MHSCQHCGADVPGNYCGQCGQKRNDGSLSFKELSHFLATEIFTVESKLLKTVKAMITQPAHVIHEFIRGNRSEFYHPIKFFILMGAAVIFFRYLLNFDMVFENLPIIQNVNMDPVILERITNMGKTVSKYSNHFMFFFVLSLSIFIKIFNRKSQTLLKCFIFSFYTMGQYFTYSLLISLLIFIDFTLILLATNLLLIYLIFALTQYLGKRRFLSILKNSVTVIFAFFIYLATMTVFILIGAGV